MIRPSARMLQDRVTLRRPVRTQVAGGGHTKSMAMTESKVLSHVAMPSGGPIYEAGSYPSEMGTTISFLPGQPGIVVGGEAEVTSSLNPLIVGHVYDIVSIATSASHISAVVERRSREGQAA